MRKIVYIICFLCSLMSCSKSASAYLLIINDSSYNIEWTSTAESPSQGGITIVRVPSFEVCHSGVFNRSCRRVEDATIESMCVNLDKAEVSAYIMQSGSRVLLRTWEGINRYQESRTPFCLNHCQKEIGFNVDGTEFINYYFHVSDEDFNQESSTE